MAKGHCRCTHHMCASQPMDFNLGIGRVDWQPSGLKSILYLIWAWSCIHKMLASFPAEAGSGTSLLWKQEEAQFLLPWGKKKDSFYQFPWRVPWLQSKFFSSTLTQNTLRNQLGKIIHSQQKMMFFTVIPVPEAPWSEARKKAPVRTKGKETVGSTMMGSLGQSNANDVFPKLDAWRWKPPPQGRPGTQSQAT